MNGARTHSDLIHLRVVRPVVVPVEGPFPDGHCSPDCRVVLLADSRCRQMFVKMVHGRDYARKSRCAAAREEQCRVLEDLKCMLDTNTKGNSKDERKEKKEVK